jgi:hypothetical protein
MSFDFLKKIIPEKPILSKEDMFEYRKYLKEIGYTIPLENNSNKKKKRFNTTPRKNRT